MDGPVNSPLLAAESDQQLLAQIGAGNAQALECLYDRYAATVYALALQTLQRCDEAEAVVIETFWRIWSGKHLPEPRCTDPARWIYSIAYQVGRDVKRRRTLLATLRLLTPCPNHAMR